ncbi:TolC family protein, partial [Myxococcota bacterium]|nr:TolC family protein [Myxococcota bacterium]
MRWPSLFLMGILISAARAAPQLGEGWTLEAAVARALAQHPARRAAKLEVEAAQAGRARASAAWLPQLQAVGQASARGPVPTLSIDTGLTLPGAPGPLTIERELGQTYAASLGAEAAWRALDFGTRGAMIEAAEAGWHAAQAGQAQIEVELAWATRQAYAAARFFEAAAEVSAKAARTAARDLADAEARLKAGLG